MDGEIVNDSPWYTYCWLQTRNTCRAYGLCVCMCVSMCVHRNTFFCKETTTCTGACLCLLMSYSFSLAHNMCESTQRHVCIKNFKASWSSWMCLCVHPITSSLCWLNEIPSWQFLLLSTHLLPRCYPHNIKNLPCSQHVYKDSQLTCLKTCLFFSAWRLYVCQTISGEVSGVKYDQSIKVWECFTFFTSIVFQQSRLWNQPREP